MFCLSALQSGRRSGEPVGNDCFMHLSETVESGFAGRLFQLLVGVMNVSAVLTETTVLRFK